MPFSLGINKSSIDLLDTTQDGVMVLDLIGEIYHVNKAICSILSKNSEELVHRKCSELECNPKVDFDEIIRTLLLKQSHIQNLTFKNADGGVLNITASFTFLRDDITVHKGVLVVLKNSLLETEEEKSFLKKQNQLLRSLNYRTDEICLVYDMQNYRNLFCSDTIEKILGWTSKEYYSGGWAFSLSITHPEDGVAIQEFFKRELSKLMTAASERDLTPIICDYRKRHKNGIYKWVRSETWVLSRDNNHQLSQVICFMKDVTLEKLNAQMAHNPSILELINNGVEHININDTSNNPIKITINNFQLSTREKEILNLVKKGLSTKEIAVKLSLTINTINTYRKSLMNKLNAKNSAELVKIAMEKNIG